MGKGQTHINDVSCACEPQDLRVGLAAMPCICGDRTFCGDLDIRINDQGVWYYNGELVSCPDMTKLLASMLKLDETGQHWLVTPTEVGRITVEDAPFVIVDFHVSGQDAGQIVCVGTNIDDVVCLGADTPLIFKPDPTSNKNSPYVIIGEGLSAKVPPDLFSQLLALGTTKTVENTQIIGLWSSGAFMPLPPSLSAMT